MNRQQSKCCSSKRHVLESSNALTYYTLQDSWIFFSLSQICGILNTSCNVYNCQPAWPNLLQTRRWCVCSDCLAHATASGPLHVQKALWPNCERSSAHTKIRNVNIPILQFHNSLLQDTLTCFQVLAFLHGPTTWLSALQPLLMLLRHAQ